MYAEAELSSKPPPVLEKKLRTAQSRKAARQGEREGTQTPSSIHGCPKRYTLHRVFHRSTTFDRAIKPSQGLVGPDSHGRHLCSLPEDWTVSSRNKTPSSAWNRRLTVRRLSRCPRTLLGHSIPITPEDVSCTHSAPMPSWPLSARPQQYTAPCRYKKKTSGDCGRRDGR